MVILHVSQCLFHRHLAFAHEHYTGDRAAVKMWYNKCIEYDKERSDCYLYLSQAHQHDGEVQLAWQYIQAALLLDIPPRLHSNIYGYKCWLPSQVETALSFDRRNMYAESLCSHTTAFPLYRQLMYYQRS
jgi:hypothetical protein